MKKSLIKTKNVKSHNIRLRSIKRFYIEFTYITRNNSRRALAPNFYQTLFKRFKSTVV